MMQQALNALALHAARHSTAHSTHPAPRQLLTLAVFPPPPLPPPLPAPRVIQAVVNHIFLNFCMMV